MQSEESAVLDTIRATLSGFSRAGHSDATRIIADFEAAENGRLQKWLSAEALRRAEAREGMNYLRYLDVLSDMARFGNAYARREIERLEADTRRHKDELESRERDRKERQDEERNLDRLRAEAEGAAAVLRVAPQNVQAQGMLVTAIERTPIEAPTFRRLMQLVSATGSQAGIVALCSKATSLTNQTRDNGGWPRETWENRWQLIHLLGELGGPRSIATLVEILLGGSVSALLEDETTATTLGAIRKALEKGFGIHSRDIGLWGGGYAFGRGVAESDRVGFLTWWDSTGHAIVVGHPIPGKRPSEVEALNPGLRGFEWVSP